MQLRVDAGARDRLGRGIRRQIDRRRLLVRAHARDDAGALTDPFVAGVDRADQVVVGDVVLAAGGAVRVDPGVRGPGGLHERGSHAVPPVRSASAATRSSGVLTATAGTPRRARLARPDERPGRGELDDAADARLGERGHAQVPAHRRGDLVDEQIAVRGSGCDRRSRRGWSRSAATGRVARPQRPPAAASSTAGAMKSVWKAPATASGMTRVPAGGSAASACSASSAPAATSWPPPL